MTEIKVNGQNDQNIESRKSSIAEPADSEKNFVKKINNMLDNVEKIIEPTISTTAAICSGAGAVTKVTVSFAKFLPLVGEVAKIFNEIVEIYQTAENNKRICGIMLDRVQMADAAVRNLKKRRDENLEFFSERNFFNLHKLVTIIVKIRKFIGEISQLKGLSKYIEAKNIEKTVKDLTNEFDSNIKFMQFSLMVDFNARAEKEDKDIKLDIDDLSQVIKHMIYVYYNLYCDAYERYVINLLCHHHIVS